MRILLAGLLCLGMAAFIAGGQSVAGEKDKEAKEVKLEGKVTCAKCDLGTAKKCETVIVVTKNKKDVVYVFDAAGHKKFHGAICNEAKQGTVTGVVDEKKLTITVKSVEYK